MVRYCVSELLASSSHAKNDRAFPPVTIFKVIVNIMIGIKNEDDIVN